MKITVKPYLFLRQTLGFKEAALEVPEGTNISRLLQILRRDYKMPEKLDISKGRLTLMNGETLVGLIVMINGRNIRQLDGVETILHDGAVISLFPPAAGG